MKDNKLTISIHCLKKKTVESNVGNNVPDLNQVRVEVIEIEMRKLDHKIPGVGFEPTLFFENQILKVVALDRSAKLTTLNCFV